MSNYDPSEPPTREITVGGKARVLAYPMLAVLMMREKAAEFNWSFSGLTGEAFDEAYAKSTIKERLQVAAVNLWAGLLHQDEKLDFNQVIWWVTFKNYAEIAAKCNEVLNETLSDTKEKTDDPLAGSPESSQTNTRSGQSVDTTLDSVTTSSVN